MDDLKLKFYPKLDAWQLNYFWGKPFEAPEGTKIQDFWFFEKFQNIHFFQKKNSVFGTICQELFHRLPSIF